LCWLHEILGHACVTGEGCAQLLQKIDTMITPFYSDSKQTFEIMLGKGYSGDQMAFLKKNGRVKEVLVSDDDSDTKLLVQMSSSSYKNYLSLYGEGARTCNQQKGC